MAITECRPRPNVDHPHAIEVRAEFGRRGTRGDRNRIEQRHAVTIPFLHTREVERWLGLTAQNALDERFLVGGQRQGWIEKPLVADGRLRHGAHGLAAGAAGAMRGPNLKMIRKFEETTGAGDECVRRFVLGSGDACRRLQEIRATEIADEDEVATDHADRGICSAAEIGDQIREVFRRVTRRMHRGESDVSNVERIAVEQYSMVVSLEPTRLPVVTALAGDQDACAGLLGELPDTGEEVRVNVGLRRRDDPKSVRGREVDVSIDVPFGIDDDRLTGALAADQIGRLRQILVVDEPKKHGRTPEYCGWSKEQGT